VNRPQFIGFRRFAEVVFGPRAALLRPGGWNWVKICLSDKTGNGPEAIKKIVAAIQGACFWHFLLLTWGANEAMYSAERANFRKALP
jgi:hypothetical protein